MKIFPILLIFVTPIFAQKNCQLDAHEHAVEQLDTAFEGNQILIDLHVPGADIVGFKYSAENTGDYGVIDAAIATLMRPLNLPTLMRSRIRWKLRCKQFQTQVLHRLR